MEYEYKPILSTVGVSPDFAGVQIYVDKNAVKYERHQTRYPKSKKKRIRMKFWKRYGTTRKIPHCYRLEDKFIMHPILYKQLQEQLAEKIDREVFYSTYRELHRNVFTDKLTFYKRPTWISFD